jgi:tetratricopeptide (TPR) repeat protein
VLAVVVAAFAGGAYLHFHHARVLTEKDTIVLADFTNTTGDSVLDDALRQGLAVQLQQSPFLNLISDERIQYTLSLMGQPSSTKLTAQIAEELCLRTNSKAVIDGSVARLGNEYVIGLDAVGCGSGDSLAREQFQVARKEDLLNALSSASTRLREKLGESLSSIKRFDMPLEQATTPSLEALEAYSLGWRATYSFGWRAMNETGDFVAARSLFQQAIRLDPNFAMAYAALGWLAADAENSTKAYSLRQRVSQRERFYIESRYHSGVSGDQIKARDIAELWVLTYPRDALARGSLGSSYLLLGQYDQAVTELNQAISLDPAMTHSYGDLLVAYRSLNRLEEARATTRMAPPNAHFPLDWHVPLYYLAFLQNDNDGMSQQITWSLGRRGWESVLLQYGSYHTNAYFGRLGNAREFSRRAVAAAERFGDRGFAALYMAEAAITEALFGNKATGQLQAKKALSAVKVLGWQYPKKLTVAYSGEALAFSGDSEQVRALSDELEKQFPEDTEVRYVELPLIRAQLALNRNDPPEAIEALQAAAPYELGWYASLYPVYVRGQAYLAAKQSAEAAAEFQRILDHRGVIVSDPIGPLAHLGLARAYVLQGDTAKARAAYQDFFVLWKDADPDIPILKEAKAEYAKLQ